MKLVLNKCYGGFSLSSDAARLLHLENDYDEISRDDPQLIHILEKYGYAVMSGEHSLLKIVELPPTATDWKIMDYDGYETVIYVLDGKIYHS